ncbi:ParA family protein [Pseudomonas savastanoi pv. phaseolicola]|uniref:AAA domain-containing protein n=2 Tax=Pseudomonas syringae group genomosp. 2 TaxID=251698 RepID=A0A3M4NP70_PSESG|nr:MULTISPECIES: ParA family protein [Pseudomonas syringae group]KPZ06411.1 hypothetical protein ALO41_200193 [Pseudomonas amygdali pv. ulmi]KWS13586.1 hypothetical protein AL065_29265 [Pseudomonas amygdali pv. ulmi]MDG6381875.1 ParA family protein [Pseudomonas savastanoi pv. phaseolicola]QOQ33596.1 Chromosome (plasmid) partitioning protein ParA [Pseudomonas syringae pv. actinidiae]RMM61890.1 hypothetical protein ALQ73_200204 [Pseudomonas savastanoi pv. glycinea]
MSKKAPLVYAVATPKGGVGKSTTLSGLAIFAARQGKKCLLIDLDNIQSLTNNFQGAGVRYPLLSNVTALFKDPEQNETIQVKVISENIHLIQGDTAVGDINRANDITLISRMKENLLDHVPNYEDYDYVLIDTPAGNGNTVMAALLCAQRVYSPIDLDHNAIGSLVELTKVLRPIRKNFNPALLWVGFVINRVPKLVRYLGTKVPESTTDRAIYNSLVKDFGENALLGTIAYRTSVKQAISSGSWFAGESQSAKDAESEFENFCTNLLEKK